MPVRIFMEKANRHFAATMVCATMLGFGVPAKVQADEWDKKTIVTINAPVEVPGKVLPPGTYVFKLLDSPSNRNIVQIWDKDERHLEATLLAIPDIRQTPTDKPLIKLDERPSNSPEAIKSWFYPGENSGWEFVYPHDRAVQLAKRINQNVLSMPNSMAQNMKAQETTSNSASNQELKQAPVTVEKPTGEEVGLSMIVIKEVESPNYSTAVTNSTSSKNPGSITK